MQRKNALQKEALLALHNKSGTLAMCTGSGKSRVGILALKKEDHKNAKFAIIVPTEKLRDENWKNEFVKWKEEGLFRKCDRFCYASIAKVKDQTYDCVILDEAHRITENNISFFNNNTVKRVIGLTATPPEDAEKHAMLSGIAPIVFEYTLKQGVEDGVVAPYTIDVIELRLNNKEKTIEAGPKKNRYMVTERKKYEMLTSLINNLRRQGKDATFATLARARFLYDLPSKTKLAKYMLDHIIPKTDRTLIFCGSIKQADELCENSFHSKTTDDDLKRFIEKKINRLSCVQALNEGHNLPDVDSALIVQLNSRQKDLIQRVNKPAPLHSNM